MLETIKEYFAYSQFHGLRFIVQKERHWVERVFWFICVCASWCGCFFLVKSSWDSFQNNAISFGTETNYIEWNTSLFAVSVCEFDYMEEIFNLTETRYGEDHDYNLDEIIKEIAFFRGNAFFTKEFCLSGDLDCPEDDFKDLSLQVRSTCENTFESCDWNGIQFDCCEYFRVLETEFGPCFSLNSMQVEKPKPLPLISNRVTGPGTLKLELLVRSRVYIHAPEDVPTFSTIEAEYELVQPTTHFKRRYGITEIVNEEEVRDVAIRQRRCRYPDENYLESYKYYSYTACLVECRTREAIRLCNCTSHLAPKTKKETRCGYPGIVCLTDNYNNYSVIINSWSSSKVGLKCSCLPGCLEPEYTLVEKEMLPIDEMVARVELSLDRLPIFKLKRSVVRGRLDLVVSMGGTVGLFVGASLLSFVEIIYFFTVRAYCTARKKKDMSKKKNRAINPTNNFKNNMVKQHPIGYVRLPDPYPINYHYDRPYYRTTMIHPGIFYM